MSTLARSLRNAVAGIVLAHLAAAAAFVLGVR